MFLRVLFEAPGSAGKVTCSVATIVCVVLIVYVHRCGHGRDVY